MHFSTWVIFTALASAAILSPGPAVFLAMAGLGALLKASATLFLVVKLAGASYLIYLGLRQWRAKTGLLTQATVAGDRSNLQVFHDGLLVALTNPKAILFFTALFPQFLHSDAALAPQFLILTGTFMALSFLGLMSYGLLAHSPTRPLGQGLVRRRGPVHVVQPGFGQCVRAARAGHAAGQASEGLEPEHEPMDKAGAFAATLKN